jgi:hypothetical protein
MQCYSLQQAMEKFVGKSWLVRPGARGMLGSTAQGSRGDATKANERKWNSQLGAFWQNNAHILRVHEHLFINLDSDSDSEIIDAMLLNVASGSKYIRYNDHMEEYLSLSDELTERQFKHYFRVSTNNFKKFMDNWSNTKTGRIQP